MGVQVVGQGDHRLKTTSDTKGVSGSHTINYQRTGRELLAPDELTHLDNNRCVYGLRGLHPFLSCKAWPGLKIHKPPQQAPPLR